jgi:peptidase, U32 family
MIDYLTDLKKAGADALKIEGRMKSLYYTALVTRAYRKRIDALFGKISPAEAEPFVKELYNTAHRAFGTGFYFSKDDANKTTRGESKSPYIMAGTIRKELGNNRYEFISMNKITADMPLEYIGPDICAIEDRNYTLLDPETGTARDWVCHGHPCIIETNIPLRSGFIVRTKTTEK